MEFFQKIKDNLGEKVSDLKSIEHAFVENLNGQSEVLLYRKQDLDGDSVVYMANEQINQEYLDAFNETFRAAVIARTGITQALIKIFINN